MYVYQCFVPFLILGLLISFLIVVISFVVNPFPGSREIIILI